MAREKQSRRMIAMALAAAVTMSSVPVVAFAEGEGSNPGSEGSSETGKVTVTVTQDKENNTTTTTKETNISTNEKSEDGTKETDYKGQKTETKVEKTDEDSPKPGEPVSTPTTETDVNDDEDEKFDSSLEDDELSKSQKTDETTTTVEKTEDGTTTTVKNEKTENSVDAEGNIFESEVTNTEVIKHDADGKWVETSGEEVREETKTTDQDGVEMLGDEADIAIPMIKDGETLPADTPYSPITEVDDNTVITTTTTVEEDETTGAITTTVTKVMTETTGDVNSSDGQTTVRAEREVSVTTQGEMVKIEAGSGTFTDMESIVATGQDKGDLKETDINSFGGQIGTTIYDEAGNPIVNPGKGQPFTHDGKNFYDGNGNLVYTKEGEYFYDRNGNIVKGLNNNKYNLQLNWSDLAKETWDKYEAAKEEKAAYEEAKAAYEAEKAAAEEAGEEFTKTFDQTFDYDAYNEAYGKYEEYSFAPDDLGYRTKVYDAIYGIDKDNDGKIDEYVTYDGYINQIDMKNYEDGSSHTVYCLDMTTDTVGDSWYKVSNLEDANYYNTERVYDENGNIVEYSDADYVRGVVKNGYWGVAEGTGSLDALKAALKDNNVLSESEINNLTAGEALAATQIAIWQFGQHDKTIVGDSMKSTLFGMGMKQGEDETNEAFLARVEAAVAEKGETDDIARINALVAYLTNLPDTERETDVITGTKFVESMEVVVGDKLDEFFVDGEDVNADTDKDNDAYEVSLKFALAVDIDSESGDMVLKVVNEKGETVAQTTVADKDGKVDEEKGKWTKDADGNYTVSGLQLQENSNSKFSLTLEGIQYLSEGVYIYTADDPTSTQTLVGYGKGQKTVDLEASVDMNFNVKEGKVTTTRKWRETWHETPSGGGGENPPDGGTDIPDSPVPMTDIPEPPIPTTDVPGESVDIVDEEPPLADIPEEEVPLVAATGDSNHMTAGFGGMLAALAGMFMLRRKKEQ